MSREPESRGPTSREPRDRLSESLLDDRPGESLGELLRLAGRRPDAPEARFRHVYRPVHAAWCEAVVEERAHRRHRRRRRTAGAVLAAAVGVLLAVGLWRSLPERLPSVTTVSPVARVEAVQTEPGQPSISGDLPLSVGSILLADSYLEVPSGALVTLRLTGGTSLRLAGEALGTRLRLVTSGRLDLERGLLYLDRPPGTSGPPLAVHTDLGIVRELGTQLEVRRDAAGLGVSVREGAAELAPARAESAGATVQERPWIVAAGQELRLDPGGTVHRSRRPAWDASWAWVQAAAPPFDPEDRTLGELLAWVERETGRRAVLASTLSPDVLRHRFHGSLDERTWRSPERASAIFLPAFGLRARVMGEGEWLEIHPEGSREDSP